MNGSSFDEAAMYSALPSNGRREDRMDSFSSMHRWLTQPDRLAYKPSFAKSSDTLVDDLDNKQSTTDKDLKQDHLQSRNAVMRTTMLTTLGLCGLLFAIMVIPLPDPNNHCYGCCSDSEPCTVRSAPEDLIVLADNDLAVNSQLSSGSEHLGIHRDHTCFCSEVRETLRDLDKKALIHDFVFRVEAEDAIPYSSFANVLDNDPESEWCSLPRKTPHSGRGDDDTDERQSSPMDLISFPQALTFLTTHNLGDGVKPKGAQVMIPSINQCGARKIQWQAGAAPNAPWQPILWMNLTSQVFLCCSSSWQYIEFNSTEAHQADLNMNYYYRMLMFTSFGNPHRISVAGVRILVSRNETSSATAD